MNDMMNGEILPIKYIPMLRQKQEGKVKVRLSMDEKPRTKIEDASFVEMWEFENGKY